MLEISNLTVYYGYIKALEGVNLKVEKGKIISIIGANGAGKTTLLNTISGLVRAKKGDIFYKGKKLTEVPYEVARQGIVQVPEGRKIFVGLTVRENLIMGGQLIKSNKKMNERIKEMYELFPILKERHSQDAGTLSGGEQQMLAIARGLMSDPQLILLDEPSLGLAPNLVKAVFRLIRRINEMGITVLLVEQNARQTLSLCHYAYVLENGKVIMQGEGQELLDKPDIKKAYLGG